MEDKELQKDLILRDLYYSPKTGDRSANHLLELAEKEDDSITLNYVKDWLKTQETYTKYKTYNNPHHFRTTFVRDLGEQIQMDLVIMEKHASENQGYKYILISIELLSRYVFAVPLKRKDGKTTVDGIQIVLDRFHLRFHEYPKLLQFDEGGEFLNKEVKSFLDKK